MSEQQSLSLAELPELYLPMCLLPRFCSHAEERLKGDHQHQRPVFSWPARIAIALLR